MRSISVCSKALLSTSDFARAWVPARWGFFCEMQRLAFRSPRLIYSLPAIDHHPSGGKHETRSVVYLSLPSDQTTRLRHQTRYSSPAQLVTFCVIAKWNGCLSSVRARRFLTTGMRFLSLSHTLSMLPPPNNVSSLSEIRLGSFCHHG